MTSDAATAVQLTVNGMTRTVTLAPDTSLLMVLRQDFDLKGTRVGCTEGHCGACTVLIDGRATQACNTPLWSVANQSITTIEGLSQQGLSQQGLSQQGLSHQGLAERAGLSRVQQAFIDEQAAQCGYCINGIIMTVTALLNKSPPATRAEIVATLDDRHLCRCGAQPRILRAIDRAIANERTVATEGARR
jgi:aerobic-type carbon monoxide dehydrogenase small subunit (CoxS/CutS family)